MVKRAMVDGDAGGRNDVQSAAEGSTIVGNAARVCVRHLRSDPEAIEIAKPISVGRIPITSVPPAVPAYCYLNADVPPTPYISTNYGATAAHNPTHRPRPVHLIVTGRTFTR